MPSREHPDMSPSIPTEQHVLGHDVLHHLDDAFERAFIASRLSTHPDARVVLKRHLVGLLASVIAAPDNIADAKGSAVRAADLLGQLVHEMLAVYERDDGV
jgi:hypothetical protein